MISRILRLKLALFAPILGVISSKSLIILIGVFLYCVSEDVVNGASVAVETLLNVGEASIAVETLFDFGFSRKKKHADAII